MTYPPQGLCPFARPPPPPRPALAALADESSASLRLPLITAAIPANSTLTQPWVRGACRLNWHDIACILFALREALIRSVCGPEILSVRLDPSVPVSPDTPEGHGAQNVSLIVLSA